MRVSIARHRDKLGDPRPEIRIARARPGRSIPRVYATSDNAGMPDGTAAELDCLIATSGGAAALDYLIARFRETGQFASIFDARLMKKRFELGVPLLETQDPSAFPPETRAPYERAMMDAAREVGELFLAEGAIERAWPYFRALGDSSAIASAIDGYQPADESFDAVVAIALQEGIHPARGLELILEKHGMCRAITCFGMYPIQKDRERCIALLVRGLHGEVAERMKSVIEAREGARPATDSIPELIAGREWLFGDYDYYVDTSHLYSVLPYSVEVMDRATLDLYHELCEYGKKLSPNFHARGQAPFENLCEDYDHYVQALRGVDVEEHVAHFQRIAAEANPQREGTAPAEALIQLLVRLGRYEEAIDASLAYLGGEGVAGATCPSALEICRLAKNCERMREVALGRGDWLNYVAASLGTEVLRAGHKKR